MTDPERMHQDFTRWALSHNLDLIVQFHDTLQSLLSRHAQDSDPDAGRQVSATVQLYDRMNAANSVLIGIAYVEELLILLWRWTLRSQPLPDGSSIKRYKPLLRELGLDMPALSCWATVQDAYVIRNCLLHANGRVSFMRDSEELRACIRRHPGALEERHDRAVVTSQFLRHFVQAARDLRDQMLKAQFQLNSPDTPA